MPVLQGLSKSGTLEERRSRHFSTSGAIYPIEFTQSGEPGDDDNHVEFAAVEDEAAPPYELLQRRFSITSSGPHTEATIRDDGRVDIEIKSNSSLSGLFASVLAKPVASEHGPAESASIRTELLSGDHAPSLNIVVQLVGSRGDIQPFLAVGLQLQAFGHRVRIATHPNFQSFVEQTGLEFFSIGGDPIELMAYMVRNAGLVPDFHALMNGDVKRKRRVIREVMEGCWRSCMETGDGIHANPKQWRNPNRFVADAIISNPPTFAHIHCAERLGVPLHIMFTMPWSPTQALPHPLANIQASTAESGLTNYASFLLIEMLTWQGVGSIVNSFRHRIGLDRVDSTWAPGMLSRLKIPHTYCWSPNLVSKPNDWAAHLNVAGFAFLPSSLSYVPPPELISFIAAGSRPIYIGFGSIVVADPQALTAIIFDATRLAGVRAVVSQGWGGLGGMVNVPSNIFILGDCPHDWLFTQVLCVVHHGGAGTTAAGLAAGKPSVVVPFFGDQQFWGQMVAEAGAGPQSVPVKTLSTSNLAAAILRALEPAVSQKASLLATKISRERGSERAAQSFLEQLPVRFMTCSLAPQRPAVWQHRSGEIKISALAATVLVRKSLLHLRDLEIYRSCEYELGHGPWEPVSGGALAISSMFYNVFQGFGEIGSDILRLSNVKESSSRERPQDHLTYSTSLRDNTTTARADLDTKTLGSDSLKGVTRIVKSTIRAPMTFTFAMAQGAHNAPRLWGDKTVRDQDKITGLASGVVAAGKELYLGTYDGIAGLFIQPFIGARDEGVMGAVKGLAKGVAGTPLKFFAAMSGSVGYSLKGLDVEISKAFNGKSMDVVRAARIAQGEQEYLDATHATREEIVKQWHLRTGSGGRKG